VLGLKDRETVSLPEALSARTWDFVTIQQQSLLSCKPESYEPFAGEIVAVIKRLAPKAEVLIQQTWAYREDHPAFSAGDGFTPQKMFAELKSAYDALSARYGFRLLRAGEAFNAARATERWTFARDAAFDFKNAKPGKLPTERGSLNNGWSWKKEKGKKTLKLDAIHANVAGRYLIGCVWFEGIFRTDCRAVKFVPEGLSAEEAESLRTIAHSVF
jgi:hypothetical protein